MILTRLTQGLFIAAILTLVMVLAKAIFVPLAFALLIAFLLLPATKFLEIKLPRVLSIAIVFLITSLLFFISVFSLANLFQVVIKDINDFQGLIQDTKGELISGISNFSGISESKLIQTFEQNIGAIFKGPMTFLSQQVLQSTSFLFSTMITGILAFLLLLYRTSFKNFIISQVSAQKRKNTREIMHEVQSVSRQYLIGLFMAMGILSVVTSLGLWAIGVKYPIFWGILATLLTLIPYVGTFIGGFLPFLYAIITTSTFWQPAAVVGLFVVAQFLDDNLIKPKVVGGQIDLNPFAAIIALITGGIIWGIPGIVLALPYMAIFKIFIEHFQETESLALLLSAEVYEKPEIFKKKYAKPKFSLIHLLKKEAPDSNAESLAD